MTVAVEAGPRRLDSAAVAQGQVRTQAERTASARKRLVRAAIRLLAERGYTGTTLAEIGREAGLSRGLVTHHFGSKDACVVAAIEEIRRVAHRAFAAGAAPGRRGLERIDHLIAAYIGSTRGGQQYIRALYVVMADAISEAPGLRAAVAEADEIFRSNIRVLLEHAVADGDVPAGTDLDAQSVLVEGILRGVCLQWFVDPERIDIDTAIAAVQAMVRASLTGRRTGAGTAVGAPPG